MQEPTGNHHIKHVLLQGDIFMLYMNYRNHANWVILDLNILLIIKLINEEFYSYLKVTDGIFNLYWQTALAHNFFYFLNNLFISCLISHRKHHLLKWEKITLLLPKSNILHLLKSSINKSEFFNIKTYVAENFNFVVF